MDDKNLRAYLAEMIGTFAFVLVSAGSVYSATLGGWQPGGEWWQPGLIWVAVASGFMYAAMLAATVPVSGRISQSGDHDHALGVPTAEEPGGRLSARGADSWRPSSPARSSIWCCLRRRPRMASHLGAPHLNLDYLGVGSTLMGSILKGTAIELMLTFVVAFTIFGTLLDPRAPRGSGSWAHRLACLWIGLALGGCVVVAFPLTGAALNPARWFGPAFWDWIQHPNAFQDNAPYWVGPIAGALLAGWVYTA